MKFIYECSFFIHNGWNTFMTISSSFVTYLQIIQEYAFIVCFKGKGFGKIYIQWIKSSSYQFQRFAFWYVRFVYITWASQLYYKQNLPWAKLWWQQMDNRQTRSSSASFNPNGNMPCNELWFFNYIKYYLVELCPPKCDASVTMIVKGDVKGTHNNKNIFNGRNEMTCMSNSKWS
jgi:hypothetical protein